MEKELSESKRKNMLSPRRTVIENEIEELKSETEVWSHKKEVMVSVTKEGLYQAELVCVHMELQKPEKSV